MIKKIIVSIFASLFLMPSVVADQNDFFDLYYAQMGSCATQNLNFNAARFSKISLNKKSEHGLDLYLQLILFIKPDGSYRVRVQEMGLVSCANTNEGEVCSYRPYPETKKLMASTFHTENKSLIFAGLGTLTKIRDDYPWQGFLLQISDEFPHLEAHGQKVIGGKVQVNFNEFDQNSARICRSL